ncbi:VOC family protein [Muricoccus radiodurans]|uniref:VOC family protein n=1 Tax=Muricoccus radiodurans TaxID=2231721 RepID=UPI003CF84194
MPKLTLDHVHLRSPDPEATGRWYETVLEARRTAPTDPKSGRVTVAVGGLNIFIDRVPAETAGTPPAPFLGLEHLAFTVQGIDAAVEAMRAQGVTIQNGPLDVRPGVRIAFIVGPENVLIELLERTAV